MTNIIFNLNKEVDINNRYISCSKSSYGVDWSTQIPSEIHQKIIGKSKQEVIKILDPILETMYQKNHLQEIIHELNRRRNTNGTMIFTIMENIVQQPIPIKQLQATITTMRRCPYNPQEWSLLYYPGTEKTIKKPQDSIKIVVHELLHMMVHYYYEDYIKAQGLTHEEFHELKESQTIILNTTYQSRLTSPDQGYQSHQVIRNHLNIFWNNNQNFKEFIDFGIQLMKNKRPSSINS